ncbi:MAG TPA: HipA domain-containing protein [Ignavibacteria bacterium]|nr:HipA domain-containing protein [Ignavibacteria bacterium]
MNCLICYNKLQKGEIDYHKVCINKFFNSEEIPIFEIDEDDLEKSAKTMIEKHFSVTGVQPKILLELISDKKTKIKKETSPKRTFFKIIFSESNYILKIQSVQYKEVPENEDLTMHLANICGIKTAKHCLIRLNSGNLAYLTKRFDRKGKNKIAVEDMCQLTNTLTERKYKLSNEKIGKTIDNFSTYPDVDKNIFFEIVLFSYISGNADMHLKNYSLMNENKLIKITPAYDLLSTKLILKNLDPEDCALTINGKKKNLTLKDFLVFGKTLGLNENQINHYLNSYVKNKIKLFNKIKSSFLSETAKDEYISLIDSRLRLLKIIN